MTFTEWYAYAYDEVWHEDYAMLGRFAMEVTDLYEKWCEDKKQVPVFDG